MSNICARLPTTAGGCNSPRAPGAVVRASHECPSAVTIKQRQRPIIGFGNSSARPIPRATVAVSLAASTAYSADGLVRGGMGTPLEALRCVALSNTAEACCCTGLALVPVYRYAGSRCQACS